VVRVLRRSLLGAFAPQRGVGIAGSVVRDGLSGSYRGVERRTYFRFDGVDGVRRRAVFDHDRGMVSWSTAGDWDVEGGGTEASPLQVRVEERDGKACLELYQKRPNWTEARRLRRLMEYELGVEIRLGEVRPRHPDLVLLWSAGGLIYYTNRDYANVYAMPDTVREEWTRPRLVRTALRR
jgi:hypothetical protein